AGTALDSPLAFEQLRSLNGAGSVGAGTGRTRQQAPAHCVCLNGAGSVGAGTGEGKPGHAPAQGAASMEPARWGPEQRGNDVCTGYTGLPQWSRLGGSRNRAPEKRGL